ncbi:helix-turn-helix domain-containing protein [Vagococcus sp.]|uniref:helix-turn-helix domain-containing protein n=1 Tax=Vagococcus sp. TaxID=1933889 RepID=UPI003F9E1834
MTEIAEITFEDREKIKKYVETSPVLTYAMLAERFKISKSQFSNIINGKDTSVKATEIIDAILRMYGL